ncbi:hypothetical protein DVH24_024509 [Malus domestica]|uniref:TIR domain-containing protein n=1 Tax=Malus domestica TaxID=3750 RepID=A0A498JIN2_MALDO|nr:hypothetical protein DVH24_024509 [Malus domestica]
MEIQCYCSLSPSLPLSLSQLILIQPLSVLNQITYILLQSIFSFNGADISGFDYFRKDFSNYKKIRLNKNFRSTRYIVEAASSVIKNNKKRCQLKNVDTDNSSGSKLVTPVLLAKCRKVTMRMHNVPLLSTRSWRLHLVDVVVRAIVAMIKTTLPGCDDGSYRQVFKALLAFEKEERRRKCSFISAACDIFSAKISGTLKRTQLTQGRKVLLTLEMISKLVLREQSISAVITSVANMVPQKYRLEQRAVVDVDGGKLLNEDNDMRSVLQYLLDDVSDFLSTHFVVGKGEREVVAEEKGCVNLLKAFIDYISERESENFHSRRHDNQSSVTLTTIHQSKGLEWDMVFIIKVNESEIPFHEFNGVAKENGTSIEMCVLRRLLYVAMTRARKKLFILYVTMDSSWQLEFLSSLFFVALTEKVTPSDASTFAISERNSKSSTRSPGADVSTEGLQSKHHDTSKETTPSTDDLKPNLLPSEVVMVQNDLHHSKFDVASAELMEFGEENHGNGFLKRFSVDERSIISHVFNDWAKKQAFQDPKRLLDKIGFVIDERTRAKNYKHKDGLRSLKSCLKDEDAFHYAQYVLRWQKIPADQRAHLMREKQEHFQKLRIENSMGSSEPTPKQISYLQSLGCTVAPTSCLHASLLAARSSLTRCDRLIMAASSSSSSSGLGCKYDVFINFRGEDTRRGFVSHLYNALAKKPINAFIDAEKLRKGDHLSELLTAIRESRLSIVVFSQNYASSTWCLKELVQILECKDTNNRIVLPIFYEVDPSDVRKLKRKFEEAFAQHYRDSNAEMEEVQSWRSALTTATSLSGWDSRNYDFLLIFGIFATKTVESIIVDFSYSGWPCLNAEAFVRMTQLRLLKISHRHLNAESVVRRIQRRLLTIGLHGNLNAQRRLLEISYRHFVFKDEYCKQHLFGSLKLLNLRYLSWLGFPLKSLPSNFQFENLVELDMQCSLIDRLWEGTQTQEKLKFINLSYCQSLKETPDFTNVPNLERLIVRSCISLVEVHPSISTLTNLVLLDLHGCNELKILPSKICMRSLKTLNLSDCSSLEMFPEISEGMEELEELNLSGSKIKELPLSINNLSGLSHFNLKDCKELKILPSKICMRSLKTFNLCDCSSLEMFPEISEGMEGLEELNLSGSKIKELPLSINNLSGLSHFNLKDCKELKILPSKIRMRSLKTFNLSDCTSLEMFPEISEGMEELEELNLSGSKIKELSLSINNLTGLSHFNLKDCKELKSLPSCIHMKCLKTFNLYGCFSLEMFPSISEGIEGLEKLDLPCSKIKELSSSINNLTRLCHLNLHNCTELKSLPSSIRMKSLKTFNLSGCSSLEMFPKISEGMEELEELNLSGSKIKELPSSINNLTGLNHLNLKDCKELKSLPSSICQLKSLFSLSLSGCTKFELFPSIEENMEGLRSLFLDGTSIKELSPWIERLTELRNQSDTTPRCGGFGGIGVVRRLATAAYFEIPRGGIFQGEVHNSTSGFF